MTHLRVLERRLTRSSPIEIPAKRSDAIAAAIGTWAFSAHDFTHDELLHAALLMLQHALEVPELENWRMSTSTYHIVALIETY